MPELYFKDFKKYYAKATVYPSIGDQIVTRSHEHISNAVDEAIEKAKMMLKSNGYVGKAEIHIEIYAEEDEGTYLIQSVKTKIVVS